MKNMLFFVLLLCISNKSMGQTGQIVIWNTTGVCTYHVTLYATEFTSGNTAGCSIMSNAITIPPGGSYGRANPNDVATIGPGYASMTFPVALATTTTWKWTDAVIQSDCTSAGCFNSSGVLSNTTIVNCAGGGASTWGPGLPPWCGAGGSWAFPTNIPMQDVVINLY
ncbi:MAG: hypothetical protein H7257_06230 [Taibaiella sp.]|nr:hypothetical protein [Taibaiella sp.]